MSAPTQEGRATVPRWTPLSELKPAPWNPRIVKTTAFKSLCASLEADPDFLWRRPILATASGEIYAGNQRYRAAEVLGWSHAPAVVEDVPDRLAKERALRDNNNAGEYQEDQLAELLYGLKEDGTLLDGLAFDNSEVDRLLASVGVGGSDTAPEAEVDRAEELRERWQTAPGQLWVIGRHRLLCGDSTKAEDVERLMGGESAHLSVTDPPYNVGVEYGSGTNDDRSFEDFRAWCQGWLAHLPPRYCMTVGIKRLCWWDTIAGEPKWIIAWVKRNGQGNTALGGTNKWDAILVYGCEGDGDIDVVEVNNDYSESIKSQDGHPTAKPVELWRRLLERFSKPGDRIYEPFTGSGTALLAAEQTGRRGYGMEIEPKYVAVTLERLSALGLTPRLEP